MIKIGEYQTLTIVREMPQGFYLEDEDENEVLLPQKYITKDMEIEDRIKVFVYCDSSDREVATTEVPMMTVDQCALLEVVDVTEVGAFCQWGVLKHLFVPFSNQRKILELGDKRVVHMYLDEVSERLVGTTKIEGYLKKTADDAIVSGQEVKCMVYQQTPIGYKVIINNNYTGVIYKNEVIEPFYEGQLVKGYVKPIREDGKIDISINPVGYQHTESHADMILSKLQRSEDGYLPFHDKSDAEEIRAKFGISKKLFKKSIGMLYKQKKILLKKDGIYKVD